jgi:hypothetical protein
VCNEELYYTNITNMLCRQKSWRMRWVRHLAHMEEKRTACKVLVGELEENR